MKQEEVGQSVASLAEAQWGMLTTAQAESVGVSRADRGKRLAAHAVIGAWFG